MNWTGEKLQIVIDDFKDTDILEEKVNNTESNLEEKEVYYDTE